ncbi:MAG: hypothetical protein KJO43_12785 [Phycisphaerae bacterium]|nr:hypothetical protein [Phycisphaerae bacterium]
MASSAWAGGYSSDFETLTASSFGEVITGQDGFYIPVAGSQPGFVYTYADNILNIPAHPVDGGDNFVGSTGGDPGKDVPFSRAQRDVTYGDGTGAWRISVDMCITFVGTPPSAQNVGSLSTTDFGASTHATFIALVTWTDPAGTPLTWDADFVWYDFNGTQLTEKVTDEPAFQGLEIRHWYRRSVLFALDTNQILETSITDLETGETTTFAPVDRYLAGGGAGGLDAPIGFRFFGGSGTVAGNTIAWDNITIEPATTDGACCLTDASCTGDVSASACADLGGIFQGFATDCGAVECFELGPDGWIVDAPFTWRDSTCGNGNDCDLDPSEDVQWEITVPVDGIYTFSLCDAEYDSKLYLGSAGCLGDIAENDDFPGCETASVIENVELEAGTYFLTAEGFSAATCGDFELVVTLSDCFPLPDNPDAVEEGEADCEDEFVDTVNGGCNVDPPVFGTMECGGVLNGTTGANFLVGGVQNRDLDWYILEVTESGPVTVSVVPDFVEDLVVFVLDTNDDIPTICDATPTLAVTTTNQCAVNETTLELDPGLYIVIVTTNFSSANCGSGYQATIICGDSCVAAPDGDLNGDGFTDFADLLEVLANFGSGGPAGDTDCNGAVEFTDLLTVIANWNPAP